MVTVAAITLALTAGGAHAAAPVMGMGSSGEAVLELQKTLKSRGFDPGGLDGVFGPATEKAVRSFQAKMGLTVDGRVGPETAEALRSDFNSRARRLLAGKTIALDPGHGGTNSGAVGPAGTREADNVLAIALELERMLKQLGGRVAMTRRTDRELTGPYSTDAEELGARVAVAERTGADLFISIHNNAYEKDPGVSGAMTFYNGDGESRRLAGSLLEGISSQTGLAPVGVEWAGFFVLRHSPVPATLVEIGFMTNSEDEKALSSSQFRTQAAKGLLVGIVEYLGGR